MAGKKVMEEKMFKLSTLSQAKLNSCHSDLILLINEVAKTEKCAVICGHRGKAEQEKAYLSGTSRAKWGQSKHNQMPSLAVDVVPLPLDWDNIESFEKLGSIIMEKAKELKINIKWGRDFTKLKDYPHFELA